MHRHSTSFLTNVTYASTRTEPERAFTVRVATTARVGPDSANLGPHRHAHLESRTEPRAQPLDSAMHGAAQTHVGLGWTAPPPASNALGPLPHPLSHHSDSLSRPHCRLSSPHVSLPPPPAGPAPRRYDAV
eukprot:3742010-Rhodomonas_salina.1